MNSIGRKFRITIFGESHGDAVGISIDGCPPGIEISINDFTKDLDRRRSGGSGTTARKETDIPEIISGVFNGFTTGAPITIVFKNSDIRSSDYSLQQSVPRPGHADFTAFKKFKGFADYRGSGHFSGRLTASLVAAGVIARKIVLRQHPEINCNAEVIEIGGSRDIDTAIQKAVEENDSIGAIVECITSNIPVGWGEPFFDSVESVISHYVFSIPAIKGIEFGSGFVAARMNGSQHNDPIISVDGKTSSNNSGGVNGGITNGNDLVFRVAVKPASSTPKEQSSLNMRSGEMQTFSVRGRHDLVIGLRVPVVLEAVTWCSLADFMLVAS